MQRMGGRYRIARVLLAAVVCFSQKTSVGQEWLLRGVVVDSADARPLTGAHVRVQGGRGGAVTDAEGRFAVPWDRKAPIVVRVGHLGFAEAERRITPEELPMEEVLTVRMARRAFELPAHTVRRAAPEVVFQRPDLHVGAYHANDEGLWVLVYEKPQLWHRQENAGEQVFRNARLHLLDTLFQERASRALPGRVRGLRHDHRQRLIVEGLDEAWSAEARPEGIVLGRIGRDVLHNAVLPWTDSIPGHLLGNNRSATWPAFDHFAYDPVEDSAIAICSVEDKHVMALFRSQYKYMSGRDKVIAMDLELRTGIDREIIAGHMTGFHKDLYFKVPYAPLFLTGDTLCVFDHASERIRRFAPDLSALDEVPMTHHKERGWRTRLLQDPVDGRIYALYARDPRTTLRPVDAATGALGRPVPLTHPFPEEVQVHGGHVYYVYRPFGSTQHRTLYREALR